MSRSGKSQTEATISVRGKDRFVVMDVAQYHYVRECELEAALAQSRADVAAGRAVTETAAWSACWPKTRAAERLRPMPYQRVFTEDYTRRALRFLKRHPELKAQYGKTLAPLEMNPHHPSLRLHALQDKLQGLHSVSINLSYRITLELLIADGQIIPVNVGDHDAVY